jgi:type VI secretion system secreted protein VgrG
MNDFNFKAAGTSKTSPTENTKRREILVKAGPACWSDDYQTEISVNPFGRYSQLHSLDGEQFEYKKTLSTFKLIISIKTALEAIVEVRCWPVSDISQSQRNAEKRAPNSQTVLAAVKQREESIKRIIQDFESSIYQTWNNRLKLEIVDPECGTKTLPITYKIIWDQKSPHYKLLIREKEIHEKVMNGAVLLSVFTTKQIFAHEFAHCLGVPDEYSHDESENRIVNYFKPDTTLSSDIIALSTGYDVDSTDPNGNIMSQKGSTKVELRHGWNIAIEAQALLRKKIGREIKCNISAA